MNSLSALSFAKFGIRFRRPAFLITICRRTNKISVTSSTTENETQRNSPLVKPGDAHHGHIPFAGVICFGGNDFVFSTVTLTSFSSGAVQNILGWKTINMAVIPFLLLIVLANLWLRGKIEK